jgi:protein SCO1/2
MASMLYSCTGKKAEAPQVQQQADTTKAKANLAMSIYQLEGTWTTQENKAITLNDMKGKVQVVSMIFTHCKYACPRTVDNLQKIERNLPAELKDKIGFTLVSFDTQRDTVSRLKQFMREMDIDNNWILLHGNDEQVRELSMLLNVNYEKMENGDFNHNVVISVLDKNGVVVQQYVGLEQDTKAIADKISSLANK